MRKLTLLFFFISAFAFGQSCSKWIFNPYTGKLDCANTGATGPAGPAGLSSAGYAVTFTGQTTQTISAATLTAGGVTTPLEVTCNPGVLDVAIDGSNNVTIKTGGSIAYTGTCTIIGGGPAGGGGGTPGGSTGSIQTNNGSGSFGAATAHNLASTITCVAASASGTAYTCTSSPSFTPAAGDQILFKADVANTGAATLNVNASSAAPLRKFGGSTALVANDVLAAQWVLLFYDGTNWQLDNTGQDTTNASKLTSGTITASLIPGESVWQRFLPHQSYVVGTTYASINDAYTQCVADVGGGAGHCHIIDYNLPETMNRLPWKADHTEKIIPRLTLGPGVLTVCSSGTGTDGFTCPAGSAFSLATGNGGIIEGVATSLSTSDTGTTIRAGANLIPGNWPNGTVNTSGTAVTWASGSTFATTGWKDWRIKIGSTFYTISTVTDSTHLTLTSTAGTQTGSSFVVGLSGVMVAWGDSVNTDRQDAFGSVIRNVVIDGNCNAGIIGVANTSTQELSDIDNVRIKNFDTLGFWSSSIRSSNAHIGLLDVIPSGNGQSCLKASTIPVLFANTGSPRPQGGMTINGLNGYKITTSSATFTASTGVISGLSGVDTTQIAASLGPNGSPTYVYIAGVATGWNGTWIVTGSTSTTITVTQGAGSTDQAGITGATIQLVPTYLMVIAAGTAAANYYAGDTSSGGQTLELSGVHMQHSGIGIQIDASSAESVKVTDISGSSDMNTVINIANAATIRDVTLQNINNGGAPTTIVDNNQSPTIVTKTNQYIGQYAMGTQPGGTVGGPFFHWSTPLTLTEIAAPNTTTHCKTGYDTLWADSTAHRLEGCDNAGNAYQYVHSGGDINTSDQVTKINGTSLGSLATGIVKNTTTTGVPSIAAASTDYTLGVPLTTFYCGGTATSSATLILPSMAASNACTTTTNNIRIPISPGKVLKNLRVRAATGGFAAGSGVFTIMRNSATSTGVTCTMGTATTCADTTNSYTVVTNDVFYIQFTTGSTETIANLAVSFEVL